MALKTKVIAGNITNLSDARYCAGMGVDWLSFPMDGVNPTSFKEITSWVTGPALMVAIKTSEELAQIDQYPAGVLEVKYQNMALVNQTNGKKFIIEITVEEWTTSKDNLIKYSDKISYLLLNIGHNSSKDIQEIVSHFPVFIKWTEELVLSELLTFPIEGIYITGEVEQRPGLKDFERLSALLEELEIVD